MQAKKDLDVTLPKAYPISILYLYGIFFVLDSTDPRETLVVDPNYFATENDWEVMRSAVRFATEIKEEPAAQGYDLTDGIDPGQTDPDIEGFIQKERMSTDHCSSTGWRRESEWGIVDGRLRVHGVNLCIADSSYSGCPSAAVSEICAEMVKDIAKAA